MTQGRRNYYKNSPARRRARITRHCILSLKTLFLLGTMVGASLFFILVHDALTQSSYFEATGITVEGNRRLTKEAILEQADVKPGDNILGVNLKVLRHRLLANPWIAAADVRRELPDTIHLRVTERVPLAKVELSRPFFIDRTGEIVKSAGPSEQMEVPVVTGLKLSDVGFNDSIRSEMFGAVMEVLHLSLVEGSVLPIDMLSRIHADPDTGLVLFGFEKGVAIHLGFGDYHAKFERLGDVISHFRQGDQLSDIDYIYLKDVDRAVVRPSEGVSALRACRRKEV